MERTLVLFTTTFPFRNITEEVFLLPELKALEREFDRIILVPQIRHGEQDAKFSAKVEVDTFIADSPFSKFKALKSPYLLNTEVLKHFSHLARESKSVGRFLSGSFFCMNAKCYSDMIEKWIKTKCLDPDKTIFYTFWFDHITSALSIIANMHKSMHIVTRAHGFDIYDDQVKFRSHIFRGETLANLSAVYPASEYAAQYLREQYPDHAGHIMSRTLGSTKRYPEVLSKAHTPDENVWTLLSCARVAKEKRVDRCFAFVRALAQAYPFKTVNWIHIGDGPLMTELKKELANTDLPHNLTIDLRGALSNDDVHRVYATEQIDWSMLLSDSEGGCPITVCESLSYGVPVIGTTVGGIPQIVCPEVGVLVSPDFSAEMTVGEIQPYLNNFKFYKELKDGCEKVWRENFDAETLRINFARELSNLLRQ
ncbi:MAG: glycosyltransferase [Muribaculum sp.]|nr:glycosyltransferase [Muribaculum sp.]